MLLLGATGGGSALFAAHPLIVQQGTTFTAATGINSLHELGARTGFHGKETAFAQGLLVGREKMNSRRFSATKSGTCGREDKSNRSSGFRQLERLLLP